MNVLLVSPLLIPLITAALCLTFWKSIRLQRRLSLLGNATLLVVSLVLLWTIWENGIQAVQLGNWPAPFGIVFVVDLLSAIMIVLTAVTGFSVAIYSLGTIDVRREAFGYHPLLNVLLMGVCGAFLTGDAFNLFVWFEVMLIASFVLLALGSERAQMEGAIKYVAINLVSSTIFLTALGLLYGVTGTLNMADLSIKLAGAKQPGLVTTFAMLFLICFGIKAAIFPLFFWLPASYHTPPAVVSALFAGLMTKVGVYALVRFFTLIFVQDIGYTHSLILGLGCLTIVAGVLGAIIQNDFRRALSFNVISQIGLVLVGLGLLTPLALSGMIFLIIEDVIVLSCLFLIAGLVFRLRGTYQLQQLGGVYAAAPGLSLLFLIAAFSIAGIPPLPGFFAKLALLRSMLETQHYFVAGLMLISSLLTLLAMTRLWSEVFWKEGPENHKNESGAEGIFQTDNGKTRARNGFTRREKLLGFGPVVILVTLTVGMGLAAEPIFILATRAAEQLLNPAEYTQAVLGTRSVRP